MTHDEVIRRVERLRDGFKRQISEGSADGYWDHLQEHVDGDASTRTAQGSK